MVIFTHTFKRMFTLKFLIIYFIIFIPILILLTYTFGFMDYGYHNKNYNVVVDQNLANFFSINFMWILGIPFLITTASRGTALIQQEIDDDTLVLLVSKPIDRIRIYLEKWLASYAISILIALISILLSLTFYIFIFKLDSSVLVELIKMVPALLIFALFINFIFTSFSVMITLLLKHRIRAIILLIVIIMLMEFIFLFIKNMIPNATYVHYKVYLYDLNYHFGMMYYVIIKTFSSIQFTPTAQQNINNIVTIFKRNNADFSNGRMFLIESPILDYIKPYVLFLFYLGLGIINFIASYFILKKKDIN